MTRLITHLALVALSALALALPLGSGPGVPTAQAKPPAVQPPSSSKVLAFAMNAKKGRPECLRAINPDGSRCRSVKAPGVRLTPAQAEHLERLLSDPQSYGEPEPKCFIPHHAFVFYGADGAVTRQVSVCLMCANLRATPAIKGQPSGPAKSALRPKSVSAIRRLCGELRLPMCDASKP